MGCCGPLPIFTSVSSSSLNLLLAAWETGLDIGCWGKKHCFTFILINLLNFLTEENVLKSKNMIICPVSCKNANFCGWRDGLETWLATPSWKRCLYVSKFMCSKRLFQDHVSCNTSFSFIKIRQFLYQIKLQDIK